VATLERMKEYRKREDAAAKIECEHGISVGCRHLVYFNDIDEQKAAAMHAHVATDRPTPRTPPRTTAARRQRVQPGHGNSDHVGALTDLERADPGAETERGGAAERGHPHGVRYQNRIGEPSAIITRCDRWYRVAPADLGLARDDGCALYARAASVLLLVFAGWQTGASARSSSTSRRRTASCANGTEDYTVSMTARRCRSPSTSGRALSCSSKKAGC
jgi:hypothetical protein